MGPLSIFIGHALVFNVFINKISAMKNMKYLIIVYILFLWINNSNVYTILVMLWCNKKLPYFIGYIKTFSR